MPDLSANRVHIPFDGVVAAPDIGREIAVRTARSAERNVEVNTGGHLFTDYRSEKTEN